MLIVKEFTFDSAHYLPGYDGPCRNLHGHTYKLQIGLEGKINPKTGMVMDFNNLKGIIKNEIIDLLDHKCLNEVLSHNFPYELPTAENMVAWMVNYLSVAMPIAYIRLYETPTSYVEWRK